LFPFTVTTRLRVSVAAIDSVALTLYSLYNDTRSTTNNSSLKST